MPPALGRSLPPSVLSIRSPMFRTHGTPQTPFSPATRPRFGVPSARRGVGSDRPGAPRCARRTGAAAITNHAYERFAEGYAFAVVNLANPDMVGHTGVLPAVIAAVEASDAALGVILAAVERAGGVALVTADHGNAEQMLDLVTGEPHTAHTTNPVPFVIRGPGRFALRTGGALGDVAPTLLEIQGIPAPVEMTGRSLLTRKDV